MRHVSPKPWAWWITHGGGVRLLFHSYGDFEARELASMAAVSLQPRLPTAYFELVKITYHPLCTRIRGEVEQRCSDINYGKQSLDGALAHWRGGAVSEVTDDDVAEYLMQRGMKPNARHEHELCPFDPCASPGNPSVVTEADGVFCFRCSSKGTRSRATWGELINGREHLRIVESAKALVPWQHVLHIIREDYGNRFASDVCRWAYTGLVKFYHQSGDPRLWRVGRTDYNLCRGQGMWLAADTLEPVQPAVGPERLAELPSCMWAKVDENGEWKDGPDGVLIDRHRTNEKLSGWHPLVMVRGAKLWGRWLAYPDQTIVRAEVNPAEAAYLPESKRVPLKDCEAKILESFPGLRLDYLKLCMAARGYAESGIGMVPLVIATGPSGAGKTKIIELAAVILGDQAVKVPRGRWQESLGYQASRGGLVILDEFAKGYVGDKLRSALDFLLEIDRTFYYRRLYAGPTQVHLNSAIFATNNKYGEELDEHEQVGRRAVRVRLTKVTPDWTETNGAGGLEFWRQANKDVCDSYLSWVTDELFSDVHNQHKTSFHTIAADLGFSRLKDSADGDGTDRRIREFFRALCKMKEDNGRGWIKLDLDKSCPTVDLWRDLCDDWSDAKKRAKSTRIDERDLGKVLQIDVSENEDLEFMTRMRGRNLLVKFQLSRSRKDYDTNRKILLSKGME